MPAEDPRDPTCRFSDRAAAYARHRPGYAAAAFEAIFAGLAPPVDAADLGAGTGISARGLAERGARVVAVEPNDAMRAAGAAAGGPVRWVKGRGEATGLAAASVDLVLSAQAFHWFDAPRALAEIRRILRPGGRVALMWNLPDEEDPVGAAYERIVAESRDRAAVDRRTTMGAPLLESRLFRDGRRLRFTHALRADEEAFVGRATSASYFPKSGPLHDRLVTALREVHARERGPDGRVRFGYETIVWLATPSSS